MQPVNLAAKSTFPKVFEIDSATRTIGHVSLYRRVDQRVVEPVNQHTAGRTVE